MATMVQWKMKAVSTRMLREIMEAGRDAGKKFWTHTKAQKPAAASFPMLLRDSATGTEYKDKECLRYKEEFMVTTVVAAPVAGSLAQPAMGAVKA